LESGAAGELSKTLYPNVRTSAATADDDGRKVWLTGKIAILRALAAARVNGMTSLPPPSPAIA
jgi:hypothetical protein